MLVIRQNITTKSEYLSDQSSISERRSHIWESIEVAIFVYLWKQYNHVTERGTDYKLFTGIQ